MICCSKEKLEQKLKLELTLELELKVLCTQDMFLCRYPGAKIAPGIL